MDEAFVREEFRRHNYSVSRLAHSLGLDYLQTKEKFEIKIDPVVIPQGPIPQDITTLGRPGMEKFVVAVKANTTSWPVRFFNAINDARAKYDAGTHEMAQQKRSDGWIVLYLIPRKQPVKREPYFSRVEEA